MTPREMNYAYSTILEDREIPIITYSIETILAEKFETISGRNITTTRARDFYDLYMIYRLYGDKIDTGNLSEAIEKTSKHRATFESVLKHKEVADLLKKSDSVKTLWNKYVKGNPYAKDIDFLETVSIYETVGDILDSNI
ncbi:nucleotidyl transferase AbiEii/AbiGii toxin family protein [Suipraeoptans intestinalis]|uniref:nucleotidyl transferase AbiEii/AbiGii toxin family protein n=1 Tax=Suipraeoptans intestinalis TaxID=2606628 RepID=UPI002ED148D1